MRPVQRFFEDLHLERLAAELALQFADAIIHLADLAVACHVIVAGDRDAPAFQHQPAPAIQQVGRNAVAPGNNRNAVATIERFLDDPQLLGGTPVTATAAVGDDLGHGHKPMLRGYPQASFLGLNPSGRNGGQFSYSASPGDVRAPAIQRCRNRLEHRAPKTRC